MDEGVSAGWLLGGRVAYRQLTSGHRSGFEPVLLAAAVAAKPGQLVLEAGTGAGAALLCLAGRVAGVCAVGLEIDADLVELAQKNFKLNNFGHIHAIRGDATAPPFAAVFDHVMANPPWHDAAATASPDAKRALAHRARPGLLAAWMAALASVLKPGGSLTMIVPAAAFAEAAASFQAARCGGVTLLPLWPRAGQPAKLAILTAKRGSAAPGRVLPGLTLHNEVGVTPAAEAVLRGGAALDLVAVQPNSGPSNTA